MAPGNPIRYTEEFAKAENFIETDYWMFHDPKGPGRVEINQNKILEEIIYRQNPNLNKINQEQFENWIKLYYPKAMKGPLQSNPTW